MEHKNDMLDTLITNNDHYNIFMRGGTANILLMILFSSITVIIPLLLNQATSVFYLSTPFYFTIVVLYFSVLYLRGWGIMVTAITLLLSALFLEIPKDLYIINTVVNILQVTLLFLATYLLRGQATQKTRLYYPRGLFYLSLYNLFILFILLAYCIACFVYSDTIIPVIIALSSILFLSTVIKAVKNRDSVLIRYTFFVSFMPSATCSILSAFLCHVPQELFLNYCLVWTLSNYIFLQTIGYIIFQIFYTRKIKAFSNKEITTVNISSAAYYIAIIFINILIIYLFYSKVIGSYGYIYFFPWVLGNIFLLSNLYFSQFDDASGIKEGKRFDWYEKRIITVEKNTSGIITIISFVLPISVAILKQDTPPILVILFASNIFFACLAVGLIWIPNKNLKFISLLKSIKTISYTYSITLLLISAILIMFTYIQ